MDIREYLKEHILITDGAMGTYYDMCYAGADFVCEEANLENPEYIEKIHRAYIEAGARLIRTNTFALNESLAGKQGLEGEVCLRYVKDNLKAAVKTARQAIAAEGKEVYIAADIGPLPPKEDREDETREYCRMIDLFLEADMNIFVMETFAEAEPVLAMASYIRKKCPSAFIIAQYSVNPVGYSQMGKSAERLLTETYRAGTVDCCGLNCNIGAAHMKKIFGKLRLPGESYVSALPNCGSPYTVRGKMLYPDSIRYFGEQMEEIADFGVRVIGGCCGTTPEYIKELKNRMDGRKPQPVKKAEHSEAAAEKRAALSPILMKMNRGEKVIAVELDPPFDEKDEKLINGAFYLKDLGIDMITIADSPMARSRADAMLVSAKIKHKVGITVLPHITCRDRNRIALRSGILGAYLNEIRNLLVVTGDPVGRGDRDNTKSVFDFNSMKLMEFVKEMNEEHFREEPIAIGGALNQNSYSMKSLLERTQRKIDGGASFFLTQPVYDKEGIETIRTVKEQLGTKILCGIMPLVSHRNAMFIRNEMPGIHVPEEIVERYRPDMTKGEAEDAAVEISMELIEQMRDVADGYYFMTPFNRVHLIGRIIEEMRKRGV